MIIVVEAKKLAYEILDKAKKGENYDQLVKDNTDDQAPGIYSMSNNGVTPLSQAEYPRNQMVPAFGNVGFTLKVGEIGIADYDPQTSPFGYHIIKRVALAPTPTPLPKRVGQDDHIQVQHILIGFKDAVGFSFKHLQRPPHAPRTKRRNSLMKYWTRPRRGRTSTNWLRTTRTIRLRAFTDCLMMP